RGDSVILEKTPAELQRWGIQIQLNYSRQEIGRSKLKFQLLMNSKEYYEPMTNSIKLDLPSVTDSCSLLNHQSLNLFQQQQIIVYSARRVEKSRLLADINVGLYSMTMKGTGADNINYTGSTRFNSAQSGIGIPLFFGSQRAKISAAKTNELIAENEFELHQK